MLDKLGKRKYVAPLLIGVLVACVMSLMFYPMANMEMKGLPFAVLSLDEGVIAPFTSGNYYPQVLRAVAKHMGVSSDTP